MPSSDWQEIYRSYSDDELTDERARLKKLIEDREGIASMGYGTKQWAFAVDEMRNKLAAVVRILNENGHPRQAMSGIVDYSGVRV